MSQLQPQEQSQKPRKPKKNKPTLMMERAAALTVKNGGNVSAGMREAGYAPATYNNPGQLTNREEWPALIEKYLPEDDILKTHKNLLGSTRLDHMTFPLGPRTNAEREKFVEEEKAKYAKANREYVAQDYLSDEDIREYLLEVNCNVRRIVHGEQARHVYFWSPDNRARKDAIELAYKIRGRMTPEGGPPPGNTYNFFYMPQVREVATKYEEDLYKIIEQGDAPKA